MRAIQFSIINLAFRSLLFLGLLAACLANAEAVRQDVFVGFSRGLTMPTTLWLVLMAEALLRHLPHLQLGFPHDLYAVFFFRSFISWSLCFCAVLLFVRWEYAYHKYPKRFSALTNLNLKCSSSEDRMCRYKRGPRS